ncbi:transcriptional regulator with XRE-family HTH domain [Variovorax boronicumulans]|uniref:helix-turn-helix domain-containing protein n=1 Tax=Variovorax boronicumulans TaxID=436515 RepID=UPI00277E93D2|nr:hypothetical protein [Variovorax boronicumulans]MDP9994517.1 transcriptional regulator with XRE-family HTH domain [Variovorax boronicumulans]MDQ0005784.1 transcriptional regulator with XRE-family HTH domain [Variovorax boronicumulans]MDQ0038584.1 transcriptional regulator with XRE-family HTH domain [Variovorax boronicumulans]MDQ0044418.1 transcriptional regulator with XRE-family HTH domain [Variovorax boronicumulans]
MSGRLKVDALAVGHGFSERLNRLVDGKGRGCQADLARHCAVTRPAITNWLSGRNKGIESGCLFAIADYFGVDARWLATGVGAEPSIAPMERKVHRTVGEVLAKFEEVSSRCRPMNHDERVGIYVWLSGMVGTDEIS